jgi:ADP-ribose pyrophosphatase YjhB (NUDIX family)
MNKQTVLALLTEAAGEVLLVRRRDSLLWSLPGGVLRHPSSSRTAFLAVCCRRQVGVAPDFVVPLREFEFAGQGVAVGIDDVARERVRACGRVTESQWFRYDALPVDLAPLARMAIGLHRVRVLPSRSEMDEAPCLVAV